MELVDGLLLRAVDAYESRHGTGPTVPELAADLGIPLDFGHHHLVTRLRQELARERLAHYRRRFTLTAAGRLALDADEAQAAPPAEANPSADPTPSPHAP